jgi:hypothetical protein
VPGTALPATTSIDAGLVKSVACRSAGVRLWAVMSAEWSDEALNRYATVARPEYVGKDPAHDWSHIRRIWSRLPWLASEFDDIDVDRAAFITAFHGLASRVRSDSALREAATAHLRKHGRSSDKILGLLDALDRHATSPVSPEEIVVHDANILEVVGAFGIAKTFTKGGAEGQSYEETISYYRGFLDAARFYTTAARAVEADRRAFAEAFLARFADEDRPQPPGA